MNSPGVHVRSCVSLESNWMVLSLATLSAFHFFGRPEIRSKIQVNFGQHSMVLQSYCTKLGLCGISVLRQILPKKSNTAFKRHLNIWGKLRRVFGQEILVLRNYSTSYACMQYNGQSQMTTKLGLTRASFVSVLRCESHIALAAVATRIVDTFAIFTQVRIQCTFVHVW